MTSPNTSAEDSMALTIVGVIAGPTLIGLLVGFWHEVVAWALKAGVLVPAAAQPLVVLPQTTAGLDAPRLAIAAAAVGLLAMVPVLLIRRALRERQVIQ
jgi:hypothetical protein